MFQTNVSEQFMVAVKLGKPAEILRIAKYGADVNIADALGRTALHQAAFQGRTDLVEVLINIGCDVNAEDQDGSTPLHRAVIDGHAEIVNQLINAGCSLDKEDKNGNTSLLEAAWNGYSQTVQLLVSAKCDINITNKQTSYSALHLASQNNHCKTLEILLKEGSDPAVKSNFGDSPLHVAARYGHVEACTVLIENGGSTAEQNNDGDTVLHLATELNNAELVEYLLDVGCFTTIENKKGETARDIAIRKGFREIAYMIHESNSPRPNIPTENQDQSPRRSVSPANVPPVDLSAVSACSDHSWVTPDQEPSNPQSPQLNQDGNNDGNHTVHRTPQSPGKESKPTPKTIKLRFEELCSIEKAFLVDQDMSKNKGSTRKTHQHLSELKQNDSKINHSSKRERPATHTSRMPDFYNEPRLQRSASDTSLHIKPSLWDLCGILTCFSKRTSPAYRKTKVHKYRPPAYFGEDFTTPLGNTIEMNSLHRRSHNNTDSKHHHSKHRHLQSPSKNKEKDRSKSEPRHAWNDEYLDDSRKHSEKKHHKHKRSKSVPPALDLSLSRNASVDKGRVKSSSHKKDRNKDHHDSGRVRDKDKDTRDRDRSKDKDTRDRDRSRDKDTRDRDRSKDKDTSRERDRSRDKDTSRGRDRSKDKNASREKNRSENRDSGRAKRGKDDDGHREHSEDKRRGKDKSSERPHHSAERSTGRHKRERARESALKAKQRVEHKLSVAAHVHEPKEVEKPVWTPLRKRETSQKSKKKRQSVDGDADVEFSDSSDCDTDGSIQRYLNKDRELAQHTNETTHNIERGSEPRRQGRSKSPVVLVVDSLNRLEAKQEKCVQEIHQVQSCLGGRIDQLEDKVDDHINNTLVFDSPDSPTMPRKYHNTGNCSLSDGEKSPPRIPAIKDAYLCSSPTELTQTVQHPSNKPAKDPDKVIDHSSNSISSELSRFANMNGQTGHQLDVQSLERRTCGKMTTPSNHQYREKESSDFHHSDKPLNKSSQPGTCIVRARYLDMPTSIDSKTVDVEKMRNGSYRDGLGSTGSSPYESHPSASAGDMSHSPLSADDSVFNLPPPPRVLQNSRILQHSSVQRYSPRMQHHYRGKKTTDLSPTSRSTDPSSLPRVLQHSSSRGLQYSPRTSRSSGPLSRISESAALDGLVEPVPLHIKNWLEKQLEQAQAHLRRESLAEREVIMAHIHALEKLLTRHKVQPPSDCYV